MSSKKPVGIPLVDAIETSKGGFGPNVKIDQIMLFSTADKNTGVYYGPPPEMNGYDITQVVIELEITESINSLAVVGSLTLIDNFNLFQDARIHGQEKLFISFKRFNSETNDYDISIQRDFLVVNLRSYERGEFRAAYVLEFASPHIYWDKVKRIGRAYGFTDMTTADAADGDIAGSTEAITAWRKKYTEEANKKIAYGDIHEILGASGDFNLEVDGDVNTLEYPEQFIYDILTTDLEIPTERVWLYGYHPMITARNSFSKMKVVIPNWRPFQAIKWLLRNTFSIQGNKTGHPWFCYDTLLAGIRIEPYEMLVKRFSTEASGGYNPADIEMYTTGRISKYKDGTYKYIPGFVSQPGTAEYASDIRRKIFEMKIGFSFDQFTKAGNGSFSTQEWYVDVATKFVFPNLYKLLHESRISYDDNAFIAGRDYLENHVPGYAKSVGENAVDFSKTNYTYFIPYNTAIHGVTEKTFPYNAAYGFQGEAAEWQGGSEGETAYGMGSGSGGEGAKEDPEGPPSGVNPQPGGQSGAVWGTSPYTKTSTAVGVPQGDWDTYRKTVAKIESGSTGYPTVGGYNKAYDGAYQMGAGAKADASRILGIPVPSREKFRGDPDLQEKMIDAYTYTNHKTLMRISPKYREMPAKEKLAVLGYAHNQGAGGARDWLKTGKAGRDGFGTNAVKYYNTILGNLGGSSTVDGSNSTPSNTEQTGPAQNTGNPETTEVPTETQPVPSSNAVSGNTEKTYVRTDQYTSNGDPQDLGRTGRTADMILRNMDFMQHTIKVMGDFGLNPGMTLDIEVQKAVDPVLYEKYIEGKRDNFSLIDEYISGTYFVTECTHVFAEKDFYTFATINRDSSSLNLD